MTQTKTKPVSIRLTSDLTKQAKHAAIDEDRSLNNWITQAVKEKLERSKKENESIAA